MPLIWRRGENPYRTSYFSLLGLGAAAHPRVINATRQKIVSKIQSGTPHQVAGRTVTEAEITEAESRLLEERTWAAEVLLAHAVPSSGGKRLRQICLAVAAEAGATVSPRAPKLGRPAGLAVFLPSPGPRDVAFPLWEDLGIPGPEDAADRALDIQLDL
jgi:hypothetical protein